jgi:hypothetical protein
MQQLATAFMQRWNVTGLQVAIARQNTQVDTSGNRLIAAFRAL